jgi:rhamnogalacturonan endolyase
MAFRYVLKEVINGAEGDSIAACRLKKFSEGTTANYISIPMKPIDGDTGWKYSPNDAVAADLDGDGEMEIVVHRTGEGRDNSQSGTTDPPVLQAYKLDGTCMWEINLGRNIREGAHYTQFMVYDLDGDGKAEVVCKTAEGSKDAAGTFCGKTYFPIYKAQYGLSVDYNENANYVRSDGHIVTGPEFLTVFDGATGTEIVTTEYDPPRFSTYNNGNEIPVINPTSSQVTSRWGTNDYNRGERYLACVANLGGENPSVVMCRGYYTRTVLTAYDYKDKTLTRRWKFDTWSSSALSNYTGQGNHNLRVADIDGDGFDEIIYGSMTVDHDGKGLYTTNLGHGDALHLTDFIPSRPGLEVLACHENKKDGTTLRDARTGEIIYQIASGDDVGRCMAADIDPRHRGVEWWSSRSGGVRSSADGNVIYSSTSGVSMNMGCWWDGDLLRELQDGLQVTKFNYTNGSSSILLNPTGCASNNGTKANPCLQADILGDWREELILRTSDNKHIRIYMTPYPTDYRFHTFLEDQVYRMSVVYQNVGYNQPTQAGFYFGPDLETVFPQKHVSIDENTYTLDPVFDAIAYEWSTGETSKTIVLHRADYPGYDEYPISLKMNFRGSIFVDTIYVKFTSEWSALDAPAEDTVLHLMENPVKNALNVRFNKDDEYVCRILDLNGKLLTQQTVKIASGQIQTFDVAELNPGVYILQVREETQRYSIRFIKL